MYQRPDGIVSPRYHLVKKTHRRYARSVPNKNDDQDTTPTPAKAGPLPSAEALRWVLEHTPIALWALDKDGIVTLSEGKALESMGFKPGELVGIRADDLYRDNPQVIANGRRALAGEEFTAEVESYGRNYESHFRPLRNASGQLVGTLAVTLDVTERKRAEKQREELQAHLLQNQKLESLGLLAGGVAHDFNNLLTAIIGSAQVAAMALPAGSPVRENLDNIESAARRAAALTRQLLAYSGRAQFDVRPVDLSVQTREIAKLLEATFVGRLALSLELPPGLPAILADIAQLQQIIMNLVINAAEAIGDRPGRITLATSTKNVEKADVRSLFAADNLVPGPHVYLEVRDTGCGMSESSKTRIFDPFFSTKFAGRGLGLAAVLGIVRAHNGGIEVQSSPGEGSTFRLFFPTTEQRPAVDASNDLEFSASGVAMIVDDDPGVRKAARSILQSFGLRVVEAVDGRDGVAQFQKRARDVTFVLLDVVMPGLGGEETLRELRRLRSDVPVVLMSGFSQFDVAERLKVDDLTSFLPKPFTRRELAEKIEPIAERHQRR
jgi:PAS domain S-box-containing protein